MLKKYFKNKFGIRKSLFYICSIKQIKTLKKLNFMKQVKKGNQDLVSLIGFLEYYLPIINYKTPTRINQGGCGLFAKHLHLVLKEMGFETELTYAISADNESEMNFLKTNNAYPKNTHFGVEHIVVNLTPYIAVDSDGLVKPLTLLAMVDKEKHSGTMTVEQLDILWNNVPSWNTIFDRDCSQQVIDLLSELPAKYERFLVEGYVDIPKADEGVKMTQKTVKAIKEQQFPSFESFMKMMQSDSE